MGTFILIGAISFIVGLLFGYLMDEKPIIIYKLRKDNSRNGTSEGSVNDDLG